MPDFTLKRDTTGVPVAGYNPDEDALKVEMTLNAINDLIDALGNTVDRLNQLIAKMPLAMTVDSSNRLRAVLDTASNIYTYEYLSTSSSSRLIQFDGLTQSRQAWQQQRSLIVD
jgi:hypothetical protein